MILLYKSLCFDCLNNERAFLHRPLVEVRYVWVLAGEKHALLCVRKLALEKIRSFYL